MRIEKTVVSRPVVPDSFLATSAPPKLRMVEKGRMSALKVGDRVLSRTEEIDASGDSRNPL